MEIRNHEKMKIRGEVTAKVVWAIGAVFFGIMTLTRFFSIGNAAEDTLDCIKEGFQYFIYFLAYALALIYLFNRKKERFAFISALIYTAAWVFSFLSNLADGGRQADYDIAKQILTITVYAVFAVFMNILVTGKNRQLYGKCLKFRYLPAALLFLTSLIINLWVELARPAGFLWDGFMLDMIMDLIPVIPICVITQVVKERGQTTSC